MSELTADLFRLNNSELRPQGEDAIDNAIIIAQLSTQKLDVKAKLASKMSKTVCYIANLKNQGMHNFHIHVLVRSEKYAE